MSIFQEEIVFIMSNFTSIKVETRRAIKSASRAMRITFALTAKNF
jgi:hypothetical protein